MEKKDLKCNCGSTILIVIITIVITAIVVGGIVFYLQSLAMRSMQIEMLDNQRELQNQISDLKSQMSDTDVSEEAKTEDEFKDILDDSIIGGEIENDYNFDIGERPNFTSITKGNLIWMKKEAIAEIYKGNGIISNYSVPSHPLDENVVFLSVNYYEYDEDREIPINTNVIYTYNIDTSENSGELEKIFEEKNNNYFVYHVVGIDGSKLILFKMHSENSPGPCWNHWQSDDHFYLELSGISGGLKEYEVSAEKKAEAQKETEKCMKDTFGTF